MHESGEDYLEAILVLKNKNGFVRSVDIANHLGFSKPSISRAMGILEKDGYIEFGLGNMINLTEKGLEKATDVYSRHQLLTEFLVKISGVSSEKAEENACRIEHDLDADIIAGIKKWMKKNS
ncbi:metal-dependent transcriptional regulator [Treponema sp.]|uniref:metal-dependent transcriptional regulator n=1 Tax=Treponema sp. TaxID=166 RepID=UPI00298D7BF1|nr:metal-dependent transcriptional regulator [Treponema sp.]MCR5613651.1 metal-dependent transcriptional regulator [Treponema sp.]